MSTIDTREYYAKRKAAIEIRLMLRYYYEGIPYKYDPEDLAASPREIRRSILRNTTVQISEDNTSELRRVRSETPDRSDGIDYMDNVAADRIDAVVGAVLPADTALRIDIESDDGETKEPTTVTKKDRKKLFRQLLNFGDQFDSDKPEQDFMRWLKLVLTDVAQTGDGLILVQYLPPDEKLKLPGRIKYEFYSYECWDRQNDPITGELQFYRVEFKYVDENGKERFYRRDYHPGKKIIYNEPEATIEFQKGIPPAHHEGIPMDPMIGILPPKFVEQSETTEAGALTELGAAPCVDLIWNEKNMDSYRGFPEIWFDDIPGIDSTNEILNALTEAVVYAGNQPLIALDVKGPEGSNNKPRDLRKEDMAAGAIANLRSLGNDESKQGKVFFPENTPTVFPHDQGMKQVRAAAMGGIPNARFNDADLEKLSRLSGFAYTILTGQFDQRVKDIRRSAVDRVLKALRLGIRLLRIKNALPDGLPDDFDITLDYGDQKITEDERSKLAVTLLAYDKLGVPRDVLIKMIPGLSTDDIEKTLAGVRERQQLDEELMVKQIETVTQAGPTAPEAGGNVDNKLK